MSHSAKSLTAIGLRHADRPDQPPVVDLDRLELPAGTAVALLAGFGVPTAGRRVTDLSRGRAAARRR